MLTLVKWLLTAATVACVVWGDMRGYAANQSELARARGAMQRNFDACAAPIRAANSDPDRRLRLLTLECSTKLDEDRWLPVIAPNLRRDTVTAAAPPLVLAVGLAFGAIFTPSSRRRAKAKAKPAAA